MQLKITVFNKSERARQGKAETDRNTGVVMCYSLVSCSSFLLAVWTMTDDQTLTVNGANSPHFCFLIFWKSFVFLFSFFFAARHPALACWNLEWEFGGSSQALASPLAAPQLSYEVEPADRSSLQHTGRGSLKPACRSILSQVCRLFICPARLLWLSQARRTLLSQVCQPFLCPTRRLWLSQARLPLVSQVHGQPLVHCPPAAFYVKHFEFTRCMKCAI